MSYVPEEKGKQARNLRLLYSIFGEGIREDFMEEVSVKDTWQWIWKTIMGHARRLFHANIEDKENEDDDEV